jgi:parvulin-like peptidyl-prolyl isomerase
MVVLAIVLASMAGSELPAQEAGKAATKRAGAATRPDPATLAKLAEPLASVNGSVITRGEVLRLLRQYPVPPGGEQRFYEGAVELLIGTRLLAQFLNEQRVAVPQQDVDAQIAEQERALTQAGTTLAAALAESGTTLEKLKDEIRSTLQWEKYLREKATDAELRKYLDQNKDAFNGSQVRASHILILVDPDASEEVKEKARQKALAIKQEIESGKIDFATAANRYSEDPANRDQPSGGDLGVFSRKGKYLEDFSAAAFALDKVGAISEPVLTEYGYHLIQLTDKRAGEPITFEQARPAVMRQYAIDQQGAIVAQQRKAAKVEIKPMPPDLFAKPAAPESAKPAGGAEQPKTEPAAKTENPTG